MEVAPTSDVVSTLRELSRIERRQLAYNEVAGSQIISALLREVNTNFAEGYLYQVLQGVANEARRRGLLINPNNYNRETYSAACGDTSKMMPSNVGWEQTMGILSRHLEDARHDLRTILTERHTSSTL